MTGAARSLALVVGLVLGTAFALTPSSAVASPARYLLEKCDPAIPGGGTEGATFHGQPPFAGANNCACATASGSTSKGDFPALIAAGTW